MPRYIIPDTCALAASLYNESYSANADPLLNAIRSRAVDAIAPSSCLTEFLNVSRKKHEPDRAGVVALSITDVEVVVRTSWPSRFYESKLIRRRH